MPLLSELVAALETRTLILRGRDVTVRGLSAADSELLNRQLPRPVPKGATSSKRDEYMGMRVWQEELSEYLFLCRCAVAGICLGIPEFDHQGAEPWSNRWDAARLRAYAQRIGAVLTEGETQRIWGIVQQIEGDVRLKEDIGTGETPGNSSDPLP